MLSSVVEASAGIVVRYYFMGTITHAIHTAKFGDKDDLRTQPALKKEWEDRNTEFSKTQGPDDAGAAIATMYEHASSDPSEPNHTTTTFENGKGQRLVYESGSKVYSKTHVYEDPARRTKRTYRRETEVEKQAREAREKFFKEKKAIRKAEELKEKREKEKE